MFLICTRAWTYSSAIGRRRVNQQIGKPIVEAVEVHAAKRDDDFAADRTVAHSDLILETAGLGAESIVIRI